ncbi:hypothetical protein [Subsaximicrobium wynnwilliamsii]|uniref:hypothetical protein n=1 Tax=Subsaximicrobium wynnwilliamsii TaxID=291179 RepID=UPI001679AB1C|nr:hypothetical protein [Subsaximicrobium wynnwilliamsii]
MNKILNIFILFVQIGITLITMIAIYMIFAISDFRGGFDGIIGIAVFQPIMAIVFSLITVFACGLMGLPIRINKKLNEWWRTKFYVSIILTFIGLLFCIMSFLPNLVQQVEYEIDGIMEIVTIPNIFFAISGWFLIAFGILHSFPPYKLQQKITYWLNRKFRSKNNNIVSDRIKT